MRQVLVSHPQCLSLELYTIETESKADFTAGSVLSGSPSGHAMGAAGVYYAMVTSLLPILQGGDAMKRW